MSTSFVKSLICVVAASIFAITYSSHSVAQVIIERDLAYELNNYYYNFDLWREFVPENGFNPSIIKYARVKTARIMRHIQDGSAGASVAIDTSVLEYDSSGRLALSYVVRGGVASGVKFSYLLDADGYVVTRYLVNLTNHRTIVAHDYSYNSHGQLVLIRNRMDRGWNTRYYYRNDGRLAGIRVANWSLIRFYVINGEQNVESIYTTYLPAKNSIVSRLFLHLGLLDNYVQPTDYYAYDYLGRLQMICPVPDGIEKMRHGSLFISDSSSLGPQLQYLTSYFKKGRDGCNCQIIDSCVAHSRLRFHIYYGSNGVPIRKESADSDHESYYYEYEYHDN